MVLFYCYGDHRDLHSFPTRRSSDLRLFDELGEEIEDVSGEWMVVSGWPDRQGGVVIRPVGRAGAIHYPLSTAHCLGAKDRKSTRLNSSHEWISYAVFCLKKKNALLVGAAGGLERLLQALAVGRGVLPAVVGAADAAVLNEPVVERDAAVGAVLGHAPAVALVGSEDEGLFAHAPRGLLRRLGRELAGDGDRLPVAAQERAARRARLDPCDPFFF